MNKKPIIAIAPNLEQNSFGIDCNIVPRTYSNAIERGGGAPFILPLTLDEHLVRSLLGVADGILFIGGKDVNPERYGEKPATELMDSPPLLDDVQFLMARTALDMGLPILGICRGAQVVNVALGGTLVQHVPDAFPESTLIHIPEPLASSSGIDHEVDADPGSILHDIFGPSIPVNSIHHQAIKEPGTGLKITARATDGVIEGTEHETRPIMTIQWHPEVMLTKNDAMLPLFEHFVGICANNE